MFKHSCLWTVQLYINSIYKFNNTAFFSISNYVSVSCPHLTKILVLTHVIGDWHAVLTGSSFTCSKKHFTIWSNIQMLECSLK